MNYFISTLSHVECYARHLVHNIRYLDKYIEFLLLSSWYNFSSLLILPFVTNKLPGRRLALWVPEETCVCEESPGFRRERWKLGLCIYCVGFTHSASRYRSFDQGVQLFVAPKNTVDNFPGIYTLKRGRDEGTWSPVEDDEELSFALSGPLQHYPPVPKPCKALFEKLI